MPSGFFWMALLFIVSFSSSGQSLSGVIQNSQNEGVKGALVFLRVDSIHATTDDHGHFSLKKITTSDQLLQIRCLGYKTKLIPLSGIGNQGVNIQLEDSIFNLGEFQIESERYNEIRANSTLDISQIDEDKINENPTGNLMNTMKEIPGINTMNTGVGIGKPVIRGLSQNRVLVAESGIKQEGQQWGNDHGLEIDQFDVEEINVIKGASSLEYGSDALGGVIQIPRPKHMSEGQFQASARTIFKTNNDLLGYVVRSKGNKDGLYYRVNLSNQYYGDYKVPADNFTYNTFVLPIYNRRLKNTAGNELHYSINLGKHLKRGYTELKHSGFNQKVGFFPGAIGIPRSNDLSDDGDSRNIELPYQEISHHKYYWHTSFFTKNDGTFQFDAGVQRNLRKEYSAPHSHGRPLDFSNELAHEMELMTYTLNLKYNTSEKKKSKHTLGLQTSYLDNQISGYEFLIPPYTQFSAGAYYIQDFVLNKKTMLHAGLRYDVSNFRVPETYLDFYYRSRYIETIQRNVEIDNWYSNFSGSLGFVQSIGNSWKSRLNVGKTFRIPNIAELSSNGVHHGAFRFERGDPNLDPESGYQLDASIETNLEKFSFGISGFVNYFDNYIYLSPSGQFPTVEINDTIYPYPGPGQVYQYKQAPVFHYGGELNFSYQFYRNWYANLLAEYVWIENISTRVPISFTPPPSASFGMAYRPHGLLSINDHWNFSFAYKYFAEQSRVDQNEEPTPAYEIVDLVFGYTLRKKNTLTINFSVQNLFNKEYLDHLSRYRQINIPEPGRNYVISLYYEFNRGSER